MIPGAEWVYQSSTEDDGGELVTEIIRVTVTGRTKEIDGSWKAGRDDAKPGILFPSIPEVGNVIRQEVAWREAEDIIEVLSVNGSESAPGRSCSNNCRVTRDFTLLGPGVNEQKFYARNRLDT